MHVVGQIKDESERTYFNCATWTTAEIVDSEDGASGLYDVPDPSRCGIVEVDDNGVVRDFVEKPRTPVGNLAFSGLMLATPALLDVIPDTIPVDLGFHVLPQIV